jgi:hypothetical protein
MGKEKRKTNLSTSRPRDRVMDALPIQVILFVVVCAVMFVGGIVYMMIDGHRHMMKHPERYKNSWE